VLTYQNELIDAVYSSTNGGITAPFQDVWQGAGRPYLQARIDSVGAPWNLAANSLANEVNFRRFIQQRQGFNEVGSERFRWRYTSSLSAMNQYLRQYLVAQKSPYAAFKTIQRLDIVARSPAGRVQKMVVTTDVGSFEINKDNILIAFYPPISTLFYIEPIYNAQRQLDGYAFVGGGFGHGVGLSQTGSYYLGQLGWTSDRILSFYYPGTQLQPINSGLTFWRDPNANAAQQP
jgi:SpoIID/LytB domain protein